MSILFYPTILLILSSFYSVVINIKSGQNLDEIIFVKTFFYKIEITLKNTLIKYSYLAEQQISRLDFPAPIIIVIHEIGAARKQPPSRPCQVCGLKAPSMFDFPDLILNCIQL